MSKYKSEKIIKYSLGTMVTLSLIFLVGSLLGWFNVVGIIVMIFGILCCVGITYPNTASLSLAPFSKNAGTASALMGAFQMAAGSLTSIIVSMFKDRSSIPMAYIIFSAALLAFIVLMIGKRMIPEQIEADGNDGNVLVH